MGTGGNLAPPEVGAPLLCHTPGQKDGTAGPESVTCTFVPFHHISVSSISSFFIAFLLILFFERGMNLQGEGQGLRGYLSLLWSSIPSTLRAVRWFWGAGSHLWSCGVGAAPSFQWRQPSLDVDVGDPNPDVVSFRSTWTKYIQENKQKWKERAASGGYHRGGRALGAAANEAGAGPFPEASGATLCLTPGAGNGADQTKVVSGEGLTS